MRHFHNRQKFPNVIASLQSRRGNQQAKNPKYCHSELAQASEESQFAKIMRCFGYRLNMTNGGAISIAQIKSNVCG